MEITTSCHATLQPSSKEKFYHPNKLHFSDQYRSTMPPSCDECFKSDPQTFWSTYVLPRVTHIEGITSRNNADSKAHTQQMLDNELSAMHLAMCSLRTRRNALSPISVLPAETLVHIFEFHAAIQPPGPHDKHHLGWIEVTHVCRLWRDTALQFSGLWNNICFTIGLKWAEVMLARAKPASIILLWQVAFEAVSQRTLDLISEHIPHARELSLFAPMSVLRSIIHTSPPPSDILTTIELLPIDAPILSFSNTNLELPGAITGCRLPSLRRLILRAFWVPWSAPILCGLTHLEMQLDKSRIPARDGYSRSSHKKIFCVLKDMPDLETLILVHCFPSGPWKDRGSDILQLPRLKVLRLEGPSVACFGIAKRLQFSPSCQVQLRCHDPTINLAEILPFLVAHASASADLPPWHTLSINSAYGSYLGLKMWRLYDALEETVQLYPGTDPNLEISLFGPEPSFGPLKPLCQALPLQNIVKVCVHYSGPDPEVQDWINVLGQCKNAKAAAISVASAPTSFCKALSRTMDCRPVIDLQTCAQVDLFLGKLASLQFSHVDFRIWQPEDDADTSQSLLIRSLTERQRVSPTANLDIRILECSIKEEWVEDLREVAIVFWDEYEGGCRVGNEEEEGDSDEDEW